MNLFFATLLTAFALLALGFFLWKNPPAWQTVLRRFPRSEQATIILFGLAAVWFLWRVWNLSPADNLFNMDFTRFRLLLIGVFGATAIGSFLYVRDLLAVRGLAILLLLFAWQALGAAFGLYDQPQRLLLVTFLYIIVVFATVIGAAPYHLRNAIDWLLASPVRSRVMGASFGGIGLLLLLTALTY